MTTALIQYSMKHVIMYIPALPSVAARVTVRETDREFALPPTCGVSSTHTPIVVPPDVSVTV